ncbi:probable helicase with zinc finger domain isoform X1 [Stylophora pistillata]|uniref:probable helicase with zinc finger domain isoform X1 n=1 Tax=Stylophora pistillata TaxID=50429 RepID=UPI000C0454DC|nr:probable helicase with zinc finger domain isoform X1 [Stylophora pistillata]
METVNNAEKFMSTKDYHTAAALFTVALRHSEVFSSPELGTAILCKRAECLLHLNYVQHVLRDCISVREIIGGENEHITFLGSHALESQGEVVKAFVNSIIYKFLDPEMKRDKNIVERLREKVKSLCGQGYHQVSRTIDILMQQGELKLADSLTEIAVSFFTEVLTLFPAVVGAYELRAQCYFKLGDFLQAKRDCNRALELTNRTSTVAFNIKVKIKIQFKEFEDALRLVNEWQTMDPKNAGLAVIKWDIRDKMADKQFHDRPELMTRCQSLSDVSLPAHQSSDIVEIPPMKNVKPVQGKAAAQMKDEEPRTSYDSPGALRGEDFHPTAAPEKRSAFPERKKRRRIRNKTRSLRAAREVDDSDASSVCSINTCPGDLGSMAQCRPQMPTFDESDQGFVSDVPKSSASQPSRAKGKSPSKEISGIRPRPPGGYTAYRLCRYSDKPELCWQGKLCTYAHSEAERKAWEEDFKKSRRRPTLNRKNSRKNRGNGTTSTPAKDLRKAVRSEEITTKTIQTDELPAAVSNKVPIDSQESAATSDDWIVVSRATKKSSKRPKDKIRPAPLNVYGAYHLCRIYLTQKRCPIGDECCFAHSETERVAWEEERKKRFHKPTLSKTKPQTARRNRSKASVGSALKEWRKEFRGQCRAPLRIPNKGKEYKMCPEWRKGTCKLDRKCLLAHGEKELAAWNEHLKKMEARMKKKKEEETEKGEEKGEESTTSSVIDDDKRPAPTYKFEDLVPSLPGVTVLFDPHDLDVTLQVPLNSKEETKYSWTLRFHYESNVSGHLRDIVLLPNYHKFYTLSSVKFSCKAQSTKGMQMTVETWSTEEIPEQFHHPVKSNLREHQGVCDVEIAVSFSSSIFGNFAQFLVLDFGKETHLAVKISVEVGSQEFLEEYSEAKSKLKPDWRVLDDGSREIVKFEPKRSLVFNNEHLIDKYGLPSHANIVPCPLLDGSQGLSKDNYIDVMHQLLFVEEFYIRKRVASYNVQSTNLHASKFVVKRDEVLSAQEGWLYGSFHVTRPITLDDADGRLLLRNLFATSGSVLISQSHCPNSTVYEALVESVEESRVILKLSARCCGDLGLNDNSQITVDIQFQINRLPLCEMHDAIDRLGPEHIRILFPAFSRVGQEEDIRPLPWIIDPKLNEDQKKIIRRIAAPSSDAPPLVVFGPFGTGKTFTLNQAVRRISVNRNNRVLICTHSNSAADIHVQLLDKYLKEQNGISASRPLRIYTPLRKLSTVSTIVKEYCLISDKGEPTEAFRLPARDDVLSHRVIVTTLGMSRALFDMELHRGFFSHILIDEAAQALETETLTPITLAGNDTKVVFTGDHMQMSPDVFSPDAKKWGFRTSLQERLFYEYKQRHAEKTLDSNVIFLTENYRSNEQVLQLASDMFYGGKLSTGSNQPLHPSLGPFMFYCALGKEELDESHFSYRNMAEVNEVVRRVRELADSWPKEWGAKDLKQVAVVSSYHYQVKTIRDGLRKNGLGQVDVETIENVQGKQFRALFVSTVRTFHTFKELDDCEASGDERPYLYFLSDPKLLNTALTRAQSLVAVVGDPFSLRTIGDCQALWEDYIERCSDMGRVFGLEHNDLEESISQSSLNINAAVFVPSGSTDTRNSAPAENNKSERKPYDVRKTSYRTSSSAPSQSPLDENRGTEMTFSVESKRLETGQSKSIATDHSKSEDSEPEQTSESDDAGDEMTESDDVGNADDFAEYVNVDETVPPKHMDEIILALKAKCEENAVKKKSGDKPKGEEIDLEKDAAERGTQCFPKHFDCNTAGDRVVHEDYNIRNEVGGITNVFLENMTF